MEALPSRSQAADDQAEVLKVASLFVGAQASGCRESGTADSTSTQSSPSPPASPQLGGPELTPRALMVIEVYMRLLAGLRSRMDGTLAREKGICACGIADSCPGEDRVTLILAGAGAPETTQEHTLTAACRGSGFTHLF
ncbi:hypothetical protein NDU88_002147 [Pleurodeles waltl]|uniref:Uncharacterized protein n=1 Tax=Pleurodeles waltl TaxID=8319 RepID=A0AAV7UAE6_PLEWA|nr:hypothetical protein NDU88_002147 [Pleurodeles waltl]